MDHFRLKMKKFGDEAVVIDCSLATLSGNIDRINQLNFLIFIQFNVYIFIHNSYYILSSLKTKLVL